ncbi:MFS transporter [Paenibacillus sp. TRM 82003]|nr:MFS transporter [Paenibacillus sp. TRM 82003]
MTSPTLFQNKSFVRLLTAQAISNIGDWLDYLALFALVGLRWHAEPLEITLVMLCFMAPLVLLGPISGVWADRWERRTMMIVSDVARVGIVLGIAFCGELWQVCLLLVLKGGFEALFQPAKNGKLKEIVPDEHMQQAAAVSGLVEHGAKIAGPALGGLLVAAVGLEWAFYIDAMTFAVSAIILLGVPKRGAPKAETEERSSESAKASFLTEFKEGFAFLRTVPFVLTGVLLLASVLLVLQIADSQFIVLARLLPNIDVDIVGYAIATSGAGMAVSAVLLQKLKLRSTLRWMGGGAAVVGLAFALVAIAVDRGMSVALLPALFFLGGASAAFVFIPFQAEAQRSTPETHSGRVFGTVGSLTTLATLVGPVAGGVLSTAFGVVPAFLVAGGMLVAIGAAMVVGNRNRPQDRREAYVPEGGSSV